MVPSEGFRRGIKGARSPSPDREKGLCPGRAGPLDVRPRADVSLPRCSSSPTKPARLCSGLRHEPFSRLAGPSCIGSRDRIGSEADRIAPESARSQIGIGSHGIAGRARPLPAGEGLSPCRIGSKSEPKFGDRIGSDREQARLARMDPGMGPGTGLGPILIGSGAHRRAG